MATATFAAGCFWGVEQRFAALPGVTSTEVGYTGGTTENPTYEEVCSHKTGHAEAVRLEYDPDADQLRGAPRPFFSTHDPTQWNRQGPDVGDQYRSAVFFHDRDQEKAALEAIGAAHGEPGVHPLRGDAGRAGGQVVARRGVPPEVLREARELQLPGLTRRAWTPAARSAT